MKNEDKLSKQRNSKRLSLAKLQSDIFTDDIWSFEQLGYKENERLRGQNHLSFERIQQTWLKNWMKETIWKKRHSVQTATLVAYMRVARSLSRYVEDNIPEASKKVLTRELLEGYLESLRDKSRSTQSSTYSQLNELTSCWFEWGFIPKNRHPLLTKDMRPKKTYESSPKALSFKAQRSLELYLKQTDSQESRLIQVLMDTGMRGSELLSLTKDALSQDNESDFYLTRLNLKFRKEHTIPISRELAEVIKRQISFVDDYCEKRGISNPGNYLFGRRYKGIFKNYSLRNFNYRLKHISNDIELTDDLGLAQHVSTHRFRHTVGTNLINSGVDMYTVQRFLGHETPVMTAVYARLHNKTMKNALYKAHKQLIDVKGKFYDGLDVIREMEVIDNPNTPIEAAWLKRQLATQSLPNGICALPIKQICPHANACLTCASFRTDKSFIEVHRRQLEDAEYLTAESKSRKLSRQYELNKQICTSLTNIIHGLEQNND